MQREVLGTIDDPSLRAYVAWVSVLPGDTAPPDDATSLVPDARARHFWDAGRASPAPFARVLGLPEGWPAWDVYLAYPVSARWEAGPPAPAFWHHQLGELDAAPRLDGVAFAAQVRVLMATGNE